LKSPKLAAALLPPNLAFDSRSLQGRDTVGGVKWLGLVWEGEKVESKEGDKPHFKMRLPTPILE